MKKFLLAALLLTAIAAPTFAQIAIGPESLGFAYAVDYGKWSAVSNGDVAAGAVVITLRDPNMGQFTTLNGRSFRPFKTNAPVLIDAGGAHPETLTPSAISCNAGALTCSISVTTSFAHVGNFTIQSGTFGLAEAYNAVLAATSGGTVVVANGFGGTTTTITTTFPAGSSAVNILDVRGGVFQFYTSSGSTYSASTAPFNQATTPSATLTTAVGAPYFATAGMSTATNYNEALVANAASANGAKLAGLKTRDTTAGAPATTTIVTGDDLFSIDAFGADGTSYVNTAGILFDSTGTIAATRVPSVIKFFTGTDAAPTVKTLALTLGADQSAIFAGPITNTGTLSMLGTAVINKTAGALTLQTTTSGNVVLAPAAAATAAVTTAARLEGAKGADIATGGASCVTGDCTLGGDGNVFLLSGTTTVDGFATAGWQAGSIVWIQTSGAVTFNSAGTVAGGFAAMALTGNLSMTANDTIGLLYDGTSWVEIALIQR